MLVCNQEQRTLQVIMTTKPAETVEDGARETPIDQQTTAQMMSHMASMAVHHRKLQAELDAVKGQNANYQNSEKVRQVQKVKRLQADLKRIAARMKEAGMPLDESTSLPEEQEGSEVVSEGLNIDQQANLFSTVLAFADTMAARSAESEKKHGDYVQKNAKFIQNDEASPPPDKKRARYDRDAADLDMAAMDKIIRASPLQDDPKSVLNKL